jgi:hypothetical protein
MAVRVNWRRQHITYIVRRVGGTGILRAHSYRAGVHVKSLLWIPLCSQDLEVGMSKL